MRFTPTDLPEVLIIDPDVYRDERGFFLETFSSSKYRDGGIDLPFVQDNHSRSVAGTLRGLHLQLGAPMGKLVRVVVGAIFDVAVDVRRGSPTFGKWVGVTLSADNFRQCYIPPGFAHGFCVETPVARGRVQVHRPVRQVAGDRHRLEQPGNRDQVAGHRAAALGARRAAADAQRRAPHPAALVRCALTPDR